jgi:hypothetical protein
MISNKINELEYPLNANINIKDVLLKVTNYSSQKIDDDIISRNIDGVSFNSSDKSAFSFNYITDDFYENVLDIKEETNDIFIKLLLCCTNYSGSENEDEDIDKLIQDINKEISDFDALIQEVRMKKIIRLSSIPTEVVDKDGKKRIYQFSDKDAQLIEDINQFLNKYKEYSLIS